MPIVRTYECPECKQQFDCLHLKREEPPPDYCDLCGAYVGDDVEQIPTSAALNGSVRARSAEQVLKAQEDSIEARAELAAGRTPGVSASEMVTALREAAKGQLPQSAQPMQQAAVTLSQGVDARQLGASLAQGTRAGPYANQGTKVASAITQGHARTAAQLQRAGQMGKH